MTHKQGRPWARVGRWVWALVFAALLGARVAGISSWQAVTFPLWGPPLGYLAFCVALWVLALAVGPWLR